MRTEMTRVEGAKKGGASSYRDIFLIFRNMDFRIRMQSGGPRTKWWRKDGGGSFITMTCPIQITGEPFIDTRAAPNLAPSSSLRELSVSLDSG